MNIDSTLKSLQFDFVISHILRRGWHRRHAWCCSAACRVIDLYLQLTRIVYYYIVVVWTSLSTSQKIGILVGFTWILIGHSSPVWSTMSRSQHMILLYLVKYFKYLHDTTTFWTSFLINNTRNLFQSTFEDKYFSNFLQFDSQKSGLLNQSKWYLNIPHQVHNY